MIIVQNERIILIGGVKQPPGKQEFTALWPCQSNQGQHSIVYIDNNEIYRKIAIIVIIPVRSKPSFELS